MYCRQGSIACGCRLCQARARCARCVPGVMWLQAGSGAPSTPSMVGAAAGERPGSTSCTVGKGKG